MFADWWPWISLAMTGWVITLSVWIMFERRSPLATVSWILGLSVLPIIGLAIYFFLGPRRFHRRKVRRSAAQLAASTLGAHPDDAREHDDAAESRYLVAMAESAAGLSARPRSASVDIYFSGADKYAALEAAIESARHHVHLEYYIWEPDEIGTRFRDRLAKTASEGVEVRLLLDGVGSSSTDKDFWRPLRDAGGHVVVFNRLTLSALPRRMANFRTHRKIAVIDGRVGFTGGMNMTSVHTGEFAGDDAWRDTHVRLEGPAARGLQMVFCEGWHYETGAAPKGPAYFPPPAEVPCGDQTVQVVSSGPDENYNAIHKLFVAAIASAQKSVCLTTPYFVPDAAMLTALGTAVLRGADVRLLVPEKNDLRLVGAASRSYYPELLDIGVQIFEYAPSMLHAKTLAVDDLVAVIGTANADARSFLLNFEVVVAFYEPRACDILVGQFGRDLELASQITPATLAGYTFFRRLGQNFSRVFSPLL